MEKKNQRADDPRLGHRRRRRDGGGRAGRGADRALPGLRLAAAVGDVVARRAHAAAVVGALRTVPRLLAAGAPRLVPRPGPVHLSGLQRLRPAGVLHRDAAGRRPRLLDRRPGRRVPSLPAAAAATRSARPAAVGRRRRRHAGARPTCPARLRRSVPQRAGRRRPTDATAAARPRYTHTLPSCTEFCFVLNPTAEFSFSMAFFFTSLLLLLLFRPNHVERTGAENRRRRPTNQDQVASAADWPNERESGQSPVTARRP